jgi:uncharacterized protein
MRRIFADTSYFVALLMPRDNLHSIAREWNRRRDFLLITSQFVLIELLNSVSTHDTASRQRVFEYVNELQPHNRVSVIGLSPSLFESGFATMRKHADKNWSLVDCTSLQIMRQMGLTEALTADRHFVQMGLRALLRSEQGGGT